LCRLSKIEVGKARHCSIPDPKLPVSTRSPYIFCYKERLPKDYFFQIATNTSILFISKIRGQGKEHNNLVLQRVFFLFNPIDKRPGPVQKRNPQQWNIEVDTQEQRTRETWQGMPGWDRIWNFEDSSCFSGVMVALHGLPQVVAYHLIPYPWLVLGVMLQKIIKMSLMNHGCL
jgi:hypothetical protein